MSTGTKIMKSGSEPPTPVELDVAQVRKPILGLLVKSFVFLAIC